MNINTFIQYLLTSSSVVDTVNDLYFNNVELLLRLDKDTNSLGLPFYRDYSTKKRQLRYFRGTNLLSEIDYPNVEVNNQYPNTNEYSGLELNSFLYLPNKYNHTDRISELNNGTFYGSDLKASYLELMSNGLNSPLNFGTGEFTIEISFYADEVNLPWRYQTLFVLGDSCAFIREGLNLNNLSTTGYSFRNCFGVFLDKDTLVFRDLDTTHIIQTNITKLKWYHLVIQRKANNLEFYINFNKVKTVSISGTRAYDYTVSTNENTSYKRLVIGACNNYNAFGGNFSTNLGRTTLNHVDFSFSGGLSNFRITKGIARYNQSFYSPQLPFYIGTTDARLDGEYNNVLYNLPLTYDLYDYSKHKAHFTNKLLLNNIPANLTTGFLDIDGINKYESSIINTNLDNDEWTIEFYYTLFLNSQPIKTLAASSHIDGYIGNHYNPGEILNTYNVGIYNTGNNDSNPKLDRRFNLLSITSNNKKVLNIDLRWLYEYYWFSIFEAAYISYGSYIALKASTNGDDWIEFQSNAEQWVGDSRTQSNLPKDELRLFRQSRGLAGTGSNTNSNLQIIGGYDEPLTHIAIQRYNNFIYFFFNGILIQSFPFNHTLYQSINNTKLSINTYTDKGIELIKDNIKYVLTQGIKGLRVTNTARYNTVGTNDYFSYHSLYPVALTSNAYEPPRARIISINRKVTLPSISGDFAEWSVYTSQQITNLTLEDFTLTQLEGVEDAELVSIIKTSDFEYTVKASTGNGSGKLGLNFIDRKTVQYKDSDRFISDYIGELSIEGEQYVINKAAPVPLLTSGSSPYIKSSFEVDIKFDGSIETFNPENIGIINGTIKNSSTINPDEQLYRIIVEPVLQDPVIVQAMPGTGITDADIPSQSSNTLTRIYSEYFQVLQLPLDIENTRNDVSPSRLILNEVLNNNTVFSNVIAPFGASSSLYVSPTSEQSGLTLENYNVTKSTGTEALEEDWTIEFFLRIDSNNATSHIFSIEDPNTGICFICQNRTLKIQRSITNSANLFSTLNWSDLATTNFAAWDNQAFTQQQKFPHFAITKQGNIYRFYRNGIRTQLIQSDVNINVTKGNIKLGYYNTYVSHKDYYLSNLRITLGKALYTSASVNTPGLPYTILPNITEVTSLLSYISIYSNNYKANRAVAGDKVTLKFLSILPLVNVPTVVIAGKSADILVSEFNTYYASITVDEGTEEGNTIFSIAISDEPNIPDTTFTSTTNQSNVIVDKSPLTSVISTQEPNNDNYLFDCYIQFNEETLTDLTLDLFTTINCKVSNLYKYVNQNKYRFTLEGLTSGEISVKLLSDKIKDLSGNFNLQSNTLTRNVTVPSYIPDVYWDNVIFLLQAESSIIDESAYETVITNNNVTLTSENSPIGLTKTLKFNGSNSSLSFNLGQSLPSNIDWTIEFYIYIKNSTLIKLNKPNILPSSNISTNSFKANWQSVLNADSYLLDVSKEQSFSSYIPGYKQRNTGNVTSFDVSLTVDDKLPVFSNNIYLDKQGILANIDYINKNNIGYYYDVSLNSNFTKILYSYKNKYSPVNNIIIGIVNNIEKRNLSEILEDIGSNTAFSNNGSVITGIFSQNSAKVLYILEESSIRVYKDSNYSLPAIAEDVDVHKWVHIALVNKQGVCKLYRDGEYIDKVKGISWDDSDISIGYSEGFIDGLINGIRITKGVARYESEFTPPKLPYSKS